MNVTASARQIPFFFIIGRPRSGTTLLRTMLDAHPQLKVPFESPVILNLYEKYKNIEKEGHERREEFYSDLLRQKKFRYWPFEKDLKNIILEAEGYSFQDLIKIIYLNYQSFFPKKDIKLLGDKNPNYSININKVFKIFPDARYIHLVRDPRDHFASVKKVDFVIPSASLIAFRWQYAIKRNRELQTKHSGRFLTVRYEDLVQDTAPTLEKICGFLKVPFHDSILNFAGMKEEILSKFPGLKENPYHKNLFRPVNPDSVGQWGKSLSQLQVQMIEKQCREGMIAFDYQHANSKKSVWANLYSLPGEILSRIILFLSAILDSLPFRFRNKLRNSPSIMATIYNFLIRKKLKQ